MDLTAIAELFGSHEPIAHFHGGQGSSLRSGSIVLKPADSEAESNWLANTFHDLRASDRVRIPKPIISKNGNWIEGGYVAWSFVSGDVVNGRYAEKLSACEAYHQLVKGIEKPSFFNKRGDAWSIADRKSWREIPVDCDLDFSIAYETLFEKFVELDLPSQVIHGDFSGNALFAEGLPPAVIDFSPYWRPANFAQAVILIDAIVWDRSVNKDDLLRLFAPVEHLEQLVLRATLRRIFEQFEHFRLRAIARLEMLFEAIKYRDAFNELFAYPAGCNDCY